MNPDRLPTPRAGGDREALQILLSARRELSTVRTGQINRLRALLLSGNDTDRDLARGTLTHTELAAITRRLARAITQADGELAANKQQLHDIVHQLAPALLAKTGIGPISAAQAIVSWSHPGRCRDEAASAALAGVSPVPASSGGTIRHRLDRGGDRNSTAPCTTSS